MGTTRSEGSLYVNISQGIAALEFGHPDGNSFPLILLERLQKTLLQLSKDPTCKVIILKSEGERAFCAGASLHDLLEVSNKEEAQRFFLGFAGVINAMRSCSKPIVGRIQGRAVGGGVGLVAACDLAFATVDAALRLSELSIGIGPFVIAPAVERKAGKMGLAALSLCPMEWKNAYWAKDYNLYTEVYESVREVDNKVDEVCTNLVSYSEAAIKKIKQTLWEGTENWNELLPKRAAISAELVLTEQAKVLLKNIRR